MILAALAAGLLSVAALAADDRDITIVNDTGYPIKFIGVNPPGDDVFNENELEKTLPNKGKVEVTFDNSHKGCKWNIKVTWADDNTSSIFRGLDLCEIDVVTLKYDKATDKATYTTK
jgi:hypothetical protein